MEGWNKKEQVNYTNKHKTIQHWRSILSALSTLHLDGITDSMDTSLSKLREMARDRETHMLQSMESQRVGHNWVTEQQQ